MNRIPIEPGRIVVSRCGRDQGRRFVVIEADDMFAMIADGDLRKVERPKKKKRKHLTATVHEMKVEGGKPPEDHLIRKHLQAIESEEEG